MRCRRRNRPSIQPLIVLLFASAATAQAPNPVIIKDRFDSPGGTPLTTHHPNWTLTNANPTEVGSILGNRYQVGPWGEQDFFFAGTSSHRARLTVIGGGDRRSAGPAINMTEGSAGYAIGFGPPAGGAYAGVNVFKNSSYVATPVQGGSWSTSQNHVLEIVQTENTPQSVEFEIYVDGVLEATYTDASAPIRWGNDGFRIGGSPDDTLVADWANTGVANTTFNPNDGRDHTYGHWIQMNLNDSTQDILSACQPGVRGIVRIFYWAELESWWGNYTFGDIYTDLAAMDNATQCAGVKYVVFAHDKSFNSDLSNPPYIMNWGQTHGVALDIEYDPDYDQPGQPYVPEGHISRRWYGVVANRLQALYEALYAEFDGHPRVVGAAVQESSISLGNVQKQQFNYDPANYKDSLIQIVGNAAAAGVNSRTYWYANFIADGQSLVGVVIDNVSGPGAYAAIGGPDILPGWAPLENLVYPYLKQVEGEAYLFNSAQNDSYKHVKEAGVCYSMQEIYEYGRDELNLSQIIWNRVVAPNTTDCSNASSVDDAYEVIAAQPDVAELLIADFSGAVENSSVLQVELDGEYGLTFGNNAARLIGYGGSNPTSPSVSMTNATRFAATIQLPSSLASVGDRIVLEIANGHGDAGRIVLREGP